MHNFEPAPKSLYKYFAPTDEQRWAWLEEIILGHKIFLSSPSDFNDPFDCLPTFSSPSSQVGWEILGNRYARRIAREFGPSSGQGVRAGLKRLSNPQKLSLLEEASRLSADQTGIYCLTELPDNVLMWSHYADNHKGVCLEFKIDGYPISHIHAVARVIYQNERPQIPLLRVDDDEDQTYNALRTKASFWDYEKEWRLMLAGGARKRTKIPDNVIASIILGARCPSETSERVQSILAKTSRAISIRHAKISTSEFRLEIGD